MKLPRDLSGEELVRHLCRRWGYARVHQVGSQMIPQSEAPSMGGWLEGWARRGL